ncbi:hypothetical protein AOC36_06920 [Erysipelothrix larvae]|uniref:Uncharacterized protein n=1 Tax=Erysipelothrix larvae TaxID=1514105 RepID=A0A109UH86_9FIRM|nr:hypothetical protein [Erysipelothrix larvae]AMC93723.1 hypothetical protein AOC36_06920 [Erysipelothrix larvae]
MLKIEERDHFDSIIQDIKRKLESGHNIGMDLITLMDFPKIVQYIHESAESSLIYTLSTYVGEHVKNGDIVLMSLSLIQMLNYDGKFYDHVQDQYSRLYDNFSDQKIESLIRTILKQYKTQKEIKNTSLYIGVALSHSIVPQKFLIDFFDFIYDIYVTNFDFDIPNNVEEEFRFVYEGIRESMLSDGDTVSISLTKKTYKLIVSTKRLISSENGLNSLIDFSKTVVELIDSYIWNKSIAISMTYFKEAYLNWCTKMDRDSIRSNRRAQSLDLRNKWDCKFTYDNQAVFLVPPFHKVKNTYDYTQLMIKVYNGDHLYLQDDRFDIREIIGGYQLYPSAIHLDDPLGEISYQLVCGEEVIYDSLDKLNRKILVFTEDGKEIKNHTDYSGTTIFCSRKNTKHSMLNFNTVNQYYSLAVKTVEIGDSFLIDDEFFIFLSHTEPGVIGELYQDHFLVRQDNKKKIPIYKSIRYFMFESEYDKDKLMFQINNKHIPLTKDICEIKPSSGINRYLVDLSNFGSDMYTVSLFEVFNEVRKRVVQTQFVMDSNLVVDIKNDHGSLIQLTSDILKEPLIQYQKQLEFIEDILSIKYKNEMYYFEVPLGFNMYRLNGSDWCSFDDEIVIDEITQGGKLDIFGNHYDQYMIHSDKGIELDNPKDMKKTTPYQSIDVSFLVTYRANYDFVKILFLVDGKIANVLYCYNKCILKSSDLDLDFDPINNKLKVTPNYYGQGHVFFNIKNEEGIEIFRSEKLLSGESQTVSNLKSFESYTIILFEREKGLWFGTSRNRVMCEMKRRFYTRNDIVGRYYKVKEVYFDQGTSNGLVRRKMNINKTFIEIKEKINDDCYIGDLLVKTEFSEFKLSQVNPVSIEICSGIENNCVEFAITNEGDGLLLDLKRRRVANTLDDNTLNDIFSYIIDLEKGGKI